jgi:addiction module HigA family antidote
MKDARRKPTHPGVILEEHYIKPLNLNLQELADYLGIARNTLFKIRTEKANVTPAIAYVLAKAFDTTPQLWLNLQQKYDLWIEEHKKTHVPVRPLVKNGILLRGIRRRRHRDQVPA